MERTIGPKNPAHGKGNIELPGNSMKMEKRF